jgi:hypothetical protein
MGRRSAFRRFTHFLSLYRKMLLTPCRLAAYIARTFKDGLAVDEKI